jgi:hypothetical protein
MRRTYTLQPDDVERLRKWESWDPPRFSSQTREGMIRMFWQALSGQMRFMPDTVEMIEGESAFTAVPWDSVLKEEEKIRTGGREAVGKAIQAPPFQSLLDPSFDDMCSRLERTGEHKEIYWEGTDIQKRKAKISYQCWYSDCNCFWACDCHHDWCHSVKVFVDDIACTACERHGKNFQSRPTPRSCMHCGRSFEIQEAGVCPLCGYMRFREMGIAGHCSMCHKHLCQACIARQVVFAEETGYDRNERRYNYVFREPRIVFHFPMELMHVPGLGKIRGKHLDGMTLEDFLDDGEWSRRIRGCSYLKNRQAFLRGGIYATLTKIFRPSHPSPWFDYGLFRVGPICSLDLCPTCRGRHVFPDELVNSTIMRIKQLLANRTDLMPSDPNLEFSTPLGVPYGE